MKALTRRATSGLVCGAWEDTPLAETIELARGQVVIQRGTSSDEYPGSNGGTSVHGWGRTARPPTIRRPSHRGTR